VGWDSEVADGSCVLMGFVRVRIRIEVSGCSASRPRLRVGGRASAVAPAAGCRASASARKSTGIEAAADREEQGHSGHGLTGQDVHQWTGAR